MGGGGGGGLFKMYGIFEFFKIVHEHSDSIIGQITYPNSNPGFI